MSLETSLNDKSIDFSGINESADLIKIEESKETTKSIKPIEGFDFNGHFFPLNEFKEFIIIKDKVFFHNPKDNISVPIDIENAEQVALYGIDEVNVKMVRTQLNSEKNGQVLVPDAYKDKYCAIFAKKVFHSFDTMKELEEFRNGPKNIGLMYTFYYPDNI